MPPILRHDLYQRFWDILLANDAIVEQVKPGNRHDSRSASYVVWEAVRRIPPDFPWVGIRDVPVEMPCGMTVIGGKAPRVESFAIRVGYQRDGDAIEALIEAAVLSQPDNLGLSWVRSFAWTRSRIEGRTTYAFVVVCEPDVALVASN